REAEDPPHRRLRRQAPEGHEPGRDRAQGLGLLQDRQPLVEVGREVGLGLEQGVLGLGVQVVGEVVGEVVVVKERLGQLEQEGSRELVELEHLLTSHLPRTSLPPYLPGPCATSPSRAAEGGTMLKRSPRALGLWVGATALAVATGAIVAGDLATLH